MTESEALTAMKCECKILVDAMTDTELTYFLTKNSKVVGTETLYNLNRAIYEALRSAITVLPMSFSRGGITHTRDELRTTLKEFQRKSLVGSADFPGVGIGVVVRDIQN